MNARALPLALALAIVSSGPVAEAQKPSGPTVKLLSAGKGPRRALRYSFQTGTTDRALLSMTMAMKNQVPGSGDIDIVIPTIDTDLTVNLGERKGDEHLYMFAIDDLRVVDRPGVMPGVNQAMATMLEKMKGMTGSAFISTRGVTRESSFLIPPGLPPDVRQMLEQTEDNLDQMSAPLPVQAIGVGARWQTRTDSLRGDIKTSQTVTYQVVSIQDSTIKLRVTITQTAKPQPVSTPTGTFELLSYKGAGSGTVTIDLRHPVPDSQVTMTVDQVMSMDIGGGKQKIPSKVTVGMTIARKN